MPVLWLLDGLEEGAVGEAKAEATRLAQGKAARLSEILAQPTPEGGEKGLVWEKVSAHYQDLSCQLAAFSADDLAYLDKPDDVFDQHPANERLRSIRDSQDRELHMFSRLRTEALALTGNDRAVVVTGDAHLVDHPKALFGMCGSIRVERERLWLHEQYESPCEGRGPFPSNHAASRRPSD